MQLRAPGEQSLGDDDVRPGSERAEAEADILLLQNRGNPLVEMLAAHHLRIERHMAAEMERSRRPVGVEPGRVAVLSGEDQGELAKGGGVVLPGFGGEGYGLGEVGSCLVVAVEEEKGLCAGSAAIIWRFRVIGPAVQAGESRFRQVVGFHLRTGQEIECRGIDQRITRGLLDCGPFIRHGGFLEKATPLLPEAACRKIFQKPAFDSQDGAAFVVPPSAFQLPQGMIGRAGTRQSDDRGKGARAGHGICSAVQAEEVKIRHGRNPCPRAVAPGWYRTHNG